MPDIAELVAQQKLGNLGAAPSASRNWDFAYTWNSGGTTFNGLFINWTDTASAAASLICNWQVGGTTRFSVSKSGHILSGTDGSSSAVSFGRSSNPNTGMGFSGGNVIVWYANGVEGMNLTSGSMSWNSTILQNGMRKKVSASTAGSGAPAAVDARNDGNTVMTNEGSTAKNYRTLPTAAAGYVFTFVCQDADGIRIVAAAGDTIRIAGTASSVAGYIETTTIGDVVKLESINATEWMATSIVGVGWTAA